MGVTYFYFKVQIMNAQINNYVTFVIIASLSTHSTRSLDWMSDC